MSSGEELLDLCYNYAKKAVASWQQEVPQYKMDNFGNSADKIREIKDFNNVVAKMSIENNLDVYEPIYEATESYDYETGQYTHVYHDIMNDEWYEGDEDFSEDGEW